MLDALSLIPRGTAWPGLVRRRSSSDGVQVFRGQLGLPADRPVIMTGHQPVFWHAGILAKYLASDALAARTGAAVAWVVVDLDRPRGVTVRYPAVAREERLMAAHLLLPLRTPAAVPAEVHPVARAGFERLVRAWNAAAEVRPVARRMAMATLGLLRPWLKGPEPAIVLASELGRTGALGELAARMAEDSRGCAEAYNAASRAHRKARVGTLDPDLGELPLWALHDDGTRSTATPEGVRAGAVLAPKALVLTWLMRRLGCDLFIHGTGGGIGSGTGGTASATPDHDAAGHEAAGHEAAGYDAVMESWLRTWIGPTEVERLAPAVVATATVRLPLSTTPLPSPEEIAHARWRAQRARHDPAALGHADEERRERVAAIGRAPDRAARAAMFAALHAFEARHRTAHAAAIAALDDRARALSALAGLAALVHDRTWAWCFHEPEVVDALCGTIDLQIAGDAP